MMEPESGRFIYYAIKILAAAAAAAATNVV